MIMVKPIEIRKKLLSIKEKKHLCRFYIEKDSIDTTIDGFILTISKEFIYIRHVSDFNIDGYKIIPIANLKNIRYGKYELSISKIIKSEGLIKSIYQFNDILLDNYVNIFKEIKSQYGYCIVESIYNNELDFCIGEIVRINTKSISIRYFDATGKLDKSPSIIPFGDVMVVEFDSNYINIFKKYLK